MVAWQACLATGRLSCQQHRPESSLTAIDSRLASRRGKLFHRSRLVVRTLVASRSSESATESDTSNDTTVGTKPTSRNEMFRGPIEIIVPRWDGEEPSYAAIRDACEAGLPDVDTCSLDLRRPQSRSSDTIASAAKAILLEKTQEPSIVAEAWSRAKWLLGLLVLQSSSSIILNEYEGLIKDHLVVTLFLTMLVGAGGNAGNQSAIKVIRGLATGKIQTNAASMRKSMLQQASVGLILAACLSMGGFVRVYVTNGDVLNAIAISVALFAIVLSSVVIGSGLPFALAKVGVDPANAGTSVQVIMDVLGVGITCITCDFVLETLSTSLGYV